MCYSKKGKGDHLPVMCIRNDLRQVAGVFIFFVFVFGFVTVSLGQSLEVLGPTNNLGRVLRDGATVTHSLTIRNAGNKDLLIDSVKASCGCTSGRLLKSRLSPGETTTIVVTLVPEYEKGEKVYSFFLLTNDPKQRVYRVGVKANVVEILNVNPEQLVFDNVVSNHSETVTQEIKITNKGTSRVDGFRVASLSPYVTVRSILATNFLDAGAETICVVMVDKQMLPEHNFAGRIRLFGRVGNKAIERKVETVIRRPGDTNIVASIASEDMGGILFAPSRLIFVRTAHGYERSEFRLRMVLAGDAAELNVSSTNPKIVVEPMPMLQGGDQLNREYRVRVDADYNPVPSAFSLIRIRGFVGGQLVSKVLPVVIKLQKS